MEKVKRKVTDFLVPKMSFFIGMGSVINLEGSYYEYNVSKSPKEGDEKAILRDWQMISQDFLDAFEKTDIDEDKILAERKRILDA